MSRKVVGVDAADAQGPAALLLIIEAQQIIPQLPVAEPAVPPGKIVRIGDVLKVDFPFFVVVGVGGFILDADNHIVAPFVGHHPVGLRLFQGRQHGGVKIRKGVGGQIRDGLRNPHKDHRRPARRPRAAVHGDQGAAVVRRGEGNAAVRPLRAAGGIGAGTGFVQQEGPQQSGLLPRRPPVVGDGGGVRQGAAPPILVQGDFGGGGDVGHILGVGLKKGGGFVAGTALHMQSPASLVQLPGAQGHGLLELLVPEIPFYPVQADEHASRVHPAA